MNTYLTENIKDKKKDTPRIIANSQELAEQVAKIINKDLKVIGKLIKEVKC